MKRTKILFFTIIFCFALCLTACASTETPYIGENGNWWVGETDTGVSAKGEKGEKGDQGERGEKGDQGKIGDRGMSIYQTYRELYGYDGTEEEWLRDVHNRLSEKEPEDIDKSAKNATVAIEVYKKADEQISTGSGFFISRDGLIATAYHVIDGGYSLKARATEDTVYTIHKVVGFDIDRDIAILKIESTHTFEYLELEDGGITPGEEVYSFGSPLGFLDSSFSSGVVASDLRDSVFDEVTEESYKQVQFTAPISQGNSGGPLINSQGKVVGVVTSTYIYGDNLNLATYIEELDNIDRTYNRSVSLFFKDTTYYQTKLWDLFYDERESNNNLQYADPMSNGTTYRGYSQQGDIDVYKIVVEGQENAVVHFAVVLSEEGGDLYTPTILNGNGVEISVSQWERDDADGFKLYHASATLASGTYYIAVEGYYTNISTGYYIYTYYKTLTEHNSFMGKYDKFGFVQ